MQTLAFGEINSLFMDFRVEMDVEDSVVLDRFHINPYKSVQFQ